MCMGYKYSGRSGEAVLYNFFDLKGLAESLDEECFIFFSFTCEIINLFATVYI